MGTYLLCSVQEPQTAVVGAGVSFRGRMRAMDRQRAGGGGRVPLGVCPQRSPSVRTQWMCRRSQAEPWQADITETFSPK